MEVYVNNMQGKLVDYFVRVILKLKIGLKGF